MVSDYGRKPPEMMRFFTAEPFFHLKVDDIVLGTVTREDSLICVNLSKQSFELLNRIVECIMLKVEIQLIIRIDSKTV